MSPHSLYMYRCSGCLCVFVKFQASEKANSEQWSEHNVVGLPYSTHTLSPATAASSQMGVYSSHTHRMPNLFFSSTFALTSKSTQRWLESTWEICVKMASTDFCLPVLNWTLLMLWWRNHTTERHKIMFLYQFFVCRATFIFCLYVCCLLFCCFCLASKSISCKRVPKKAHSTKCSFAAQTANSFALFLSAVSVGVLCAPVCVHVIETAELAHSETVEHFMFRMRMANTHQRRRRDKQMYVHMSMAESYRQFAFIAFDVWESHAKRWWRTQNKVPHHTFLLFIRIAQSGNVDCWRSCTPVR